MGGTAQPADLATPLDALHRAAGARLVPFAGYGMPVQYPAGILAEHAWTRASAGLFDVSHMGQARLVARDFVTAALALERHHARVGDADAQHAFEEAAREVAIEVGKGRVVDDGMVARPAGREGELLLVVNAGTKEMDYRLIAAALPAGVDLVPLRDRAMVALQGPEAAAVMSEVAPGAESMAFMAVAEMAVAGLSALVSRSGYTGEDGFEISVLARDAEALWTALVADARVRSVGLGARDSLRLEAGLPLYGHDLNQETSPVEAGLAWSIGRRRRQEGGFPGQLRMARELREGPIRRRVGIRLDGKAPAREHADILDGSGQLVGRVTSGGYGPTVGGPIAMGYVVADVAAVGTALGLVVRDKALPGRVVRLPFVPHRYKR